MLISIFQHEVQVLNSLHRDVAQLVERSVWDREAGGSSPLIPTKNALVAQLVEHFTCNEAVAGSIPA